MIGPDGAGAPPRLSQVALCDDDNWRPLRRAVAVAEMCLPPLAPDEEVGARVVRMFEWALDAAES